MSADKIAEIRKIVGHVPAKGDVVQPDFAGRQQRINDALSLYDSVRIYPRMDIGEINPKRMEIYKGHLSEYAEKGSVRVVRKSSIRSEFGQPAVINTSLDVPPEGVDVPTIEAIGLLQTYPLLLAVEPPPRAVKEKK